MLSVVPGALSRDCSGPLPGWKWCEISARMVLHGTMLPYFYGTRTRLFFGTIFLAGLPSDEAIISVLAHELVHIADGSEDSLNLLFKAVGNRASKLTGLKIHDQRAEELTSDLVGTLSARSYVVAAPSYEPLPRRLSRSMEHNCVDQDEGDDDHLSPRNTIRALLALNPMLSHELVYGR